MRVAVPPQLKDVHHVKLCYGKGRYCGHPRQLPIRNFGGGEIAVSHFHAPATYKTREDISHPAAIESVKPGGLLWFSYPKKSSAIKTDIARDVGWETVAGAGLEARHPDRHRRDVVDAPVSPGERRQA